MDTCFALERQTWNKGIKESAFSLYVLIMNVYVANTFLSLSVGRSILALLTHLRPLYS